MNKRRQTFEPVPPLSLKEGSLIHSSARTSVTTNARPDGPAEVLVASSRLEMAVGPGGCLLVRYTVTPLARVPARSGNRRMVNPRR